MKFVPRSVATTRERCQHHSPSGRRCSQPACSTHPTLCFTHRPRPEPPRSPDDALIKELSQAAATLDTPAHINDALKIIFQALAADRITARKAGTMGYLAQLMLFSHREIALYSKTQRELQKQEEADERHRKFNEEQDARAKRIAEYYAAKRREEEATEEAARQAAKAHGKGEPAVHGSNMECGSPAAAVTVAANAEPEKRERCSRTPHEPPATSPEQKSRSEDRPLHGKDMAAVTISASPKSKRREPCSRTPHEPVAARKLPPPVVNVSPTPPLYLDHFYPRDPTLAPGLQSPLNTCAPPPDAEELRWRELSRQDARARRR